MATYDVIVVGGGVGGCIAAALLSKLGRRVILLEKYPQLGGRVHPVDYQGYTLDLGAHLIEDTGSGICRIYEFLGKKIEVGAVSDALPVFADGKWKHIGEVFRGNKSTFKSVIKELVSSDYSEFDGYDHLPLRAWLLERNADQGTIDFFEFLAALEQITDQWFDHSASENLYVRKMHYEEKGMAGYSFWPKGGYENLFNQLKEAIEENSGEVRTETEVSQVLVEDGKVLGVVARPAKRDVVNEYSYGEVLEASVVISNLPVWSVLNIIPQGALPSWYVDIIRSVASEKNKACWIGIYAGSEEPIIAKSEKELCAWIETPRTGLPGFSFTVSNYDDSVAPDGKHLFVCGFSCKAEEIRDKAWLRNMFHNIEADLEDMFPSFKRTLWRKKHTVLEPAFGLQGKPGVVGRFRPDFVAPNVDGLYFVSDTFRGRGIGIDKVSRTALSCVERIQGEKIPFFDKTWRY
ncbi:MAG: NAD(P)/FAD-dependent oxidoreductase [Methanomassiliicoccales archaeon]|nr:MAG: NAD(P)/FAD-dependent oxidoreductase [Methanomassiliicoccales archaeon]